MKEIHVIKRNGEKELLNLDKVHAMVEHACNGLAGVSESQVEMNAGLQFFDVSRPLIFRKSSFALPMILFLWKHLIISLLLLDCFCLVLGKQYIMVTLMDTLLFLEHVKNCVELGVYDSDILSKYSEEEWEKLNSYIDHDRDFLFTYAGIRQVADKYLVQDRSTGEVFETPQFMYILVALTLFQDDDKFYRLEYVKRYYDAISKPDSTFPHLSWRGLELHFDNLQAVFLLMLMTPSIAFLVATWRHWSLPLHSVLESALTRVASEASTVRSGAVKFSTQALYHFSKSLSPTVRCCTKMASEVESATVHFPIWRKK